MALLHLRHILIVTWGLWLYIWPCTTSVLAGRRLANAWTFSARPFVGVMRNFFHCGIAIWADIFWIGVDGGNTGSSFGCIFGVFIAPFFSVKNLIFVSCLALLFLWLALIILETGFDGRMLGISRSFRFICFCARSSADQTVL